MPPSVEDDNQVPSLAWIPDYEFTTGREAVELCELAGLKLDDWQKFILTHSLGERHEKWAAFEVAIIVPRQNGKTALAVARSLVGLFLLGERLIIHSAHQFDTSLEAFRLLLHLVENTPEFDRQVRRKSRAHGEEGIELKNGQRIRFRTRTKGGGRGFTSDCLILDEAMILPEMTVGALLPTLSARPNPQVWYCASAVDQQIHDEGVVLARLRERAIAEGDEGLAFFEWSAPGFKHPGEVTEQDAADPAIQKRANPGWEKRISANHVAREQKSMDPRTFAVERLGVGDYPDPKEVSKRPIAPDLWRTRGDLTSVALDPVCFAVDTMPEREKSAIGVAAKREDGLYHVEIVLHRAGTGWVVESLVKAMRRNANVGVMVDGVGPAAALIPEMEEAQLDVRTLNSSEHAAACGVIFDLVEQDELRHLEQRMLLEAIAGAVKRPLGDRWAWSRINSTIDISPLVAITIGLWGLVTQEDRIPTVWNLDQIAAEKAEREREGEPEKPPPEGEAARKDFVSLEDAPTGPARVWGR